MDEFLKMDVFFVVTTVAVVVVGALLSYALYRIIRILRHVERLSETVSDEAELIRDDLDQARIAARREGYRLSSLLRSVWRVGDGIRKRSKKK